MGMDDRSALIGELSAAYEAEYCRSAAPAWAFQGIAPAIPYVGERFLKAPKKVLIYASAENLAADPLHLENLRALPVNAQMHRSYGRTPRQHEDQNVHIEPINNGALLKLARHALSYLPVESEFTTNSSMSFLEQVAVANPGKFSIDPNRLDRKPRKNLDYAGDPDMFAAQRSYLEADLSHIGPQIVILPRKIFDSLRSAGMEGLFYRLNHIILIQQVQFQAVYGRGRRRQPRAPRSEWNTTTGYGAWRSPWYADAYVQWITENKDAGSVRDRLIEF